MQWVWVDLGQLGVLRGNKSGRGSLVQAYGGRKVSSLFSNGGIFGTALRLDETL